VDTHAVIVALGRVWMREYDHVSDVKHEHSRQQAPLYPATIKEAVCRSPVRSSSHARFPASSCSTQRQQAMTRPMLASHLFGRSKSMVQRWTVWSGLLQLQLTATDAW